MSWIRPTWRARRWIAPIPPAASPLDLLGDLVMDVGGGQHRFGAFDAGLVLQPTQDATLASVQLATDNGVHSKTSWGRTSRIVKHLDYSLNPGGFRVS